MLNGMAENGLRAADFWSLKSLEIVSLARGNPRLSFPRYDYDLCMCDIKRHAHQFLSRNKIKYEMMKTDVNVVLAERKLTSYVYAVGKQPTGNL
ncbi:hypothetical protein TIFTF001_038907 [Ficus carica]|uniref:Uncharacterized protein n=1 Tax=Ficus carica TaxID=3494 RepID=A0AA88JDI8_FICCA|nr:hypothetical protein TIFTF001_038907 [Ficus carica]